MNVRQVILALGSIWLTQVLADPIEVKEVTDISTKDLAVLGSAVGVHFKKFDYEAPEDHCLHFQVELLSAGGGAETHDLGGLCELSGPYRLTIQWRTQDGEVTFEAHQWRRDSVEGGSVGGFKIPVDTRYLGLSAVPPPEFDFNRKTLLVSGAFGSPPTGTEFKVLAELRPNPHARMGTE